MVLSAPQRPVAPELRLAPAVPDTQGFGRGMGEPGGLGPGMGEPGGLGPDMGEP